MPVLVKGHNVRSGTKANACHCYVKAGTGVDRLTHEKLRAKFPATITGCSMLKIACLNDPFSEVFLTASKPSRRSITAAKRREKEKKERQKIIPKIEKPKDVAHFLVQKLSKF